MSGIVGPGSPAPPGLEPGEFGDYQFAAPVEEHAIGTPAVGGPADGGVAANDSHDEEQLPQRETANEPSSSSANPPPNFPPPITGNVGGKGGIVNTGPGFVQQGQYIPMGSGLAGIGGPSGMAMIGNNGGQGGPGGVHLMQMPTAGGGMSMSGTAGPQQIGGNNFVQQNGLPSVYDHAIAQKMAHRTNLLANQHQQLGQDVQQVLQAGELNFNHFSQGVAQFQNQAQQQQVLLAEQQRLQREEQARILQQQQAQQQEQQRIQLQQQQFLQHQQTQQHQQAQQAMQLQNGLQGVGQQYTNQQGATNQQNELIASLAQGLKDVQTQLQQQQRLNAQGGGSSSQQSKTTGEAAAAAQQFLFSGNIDPASLPGITVEHAAPIGSKGGLSSAGSPQLLPPQGGQLPPGVGMPGGSRVWDVPRAFLNPAATNFVPLGGAVGNPAYGYGSALNGGGSPPRHGFLGYHAEPVPMPSTVDPVGGPGTAGGAVERRIFRFKKISFESEYKLTYGKSPAVRLLLRAKDRLPDKVAPSQQSYNNFEEWLAATESYLLRFVHQPTEKEDSYLFPEELENEIIEDLLYQPAGEEGKGTSAYKFRNAIPGKMKERLRRLRFERKNRHTLTFLNLTYQLYTEYPRSFVLNRDERDAFLGFKRNSGESDMQMLNRYVQVAQNAGQNIYPASLPERQSVWEELSRKVPDIDADLVTMMMMSDRYASPQVPFIENYVAFLSNREEYSSFMVRRKNAGTSRELVAAGREAPERVAAAKADPKSRFKYNPRNPKGNFSGDRGGAAGGAGPGVRKGNGKGKGKGIRCKFCWGNHPTEQCKYTEPVCRICFKPGHFERECKNKPESKVGAMMSTDALKQKPLGERVAGLLQELGPTERERVMILTVDSKDVERKYIVEDQTISGNKERVFCTEVNDEFAEYCEVVMGVHDPSEGAPGDHEEEEDLEFDVPPPPNGDDSEDEDVRLTREPRTLVLSGQEFDLDKFDVAFFPTALNANGYGCGKSADPSDGGDYCITEVRDEVQKLLEENGLSGATVNVQTEPAEKVLFTTERDKAQMDSGYTNQVFVSRKTARDNKKMAEDNGLKVPSRGVNGNAQGIGEASMTILGKVALPYIVRRKADQSVYCYGFEELAVTEKGPNLCGLQFQKKNFCSAVCEVGVRDHLRGHDGSWIVDFDEDSQIFVNIFSYTARDFEVLRQIQLHNDEKDWCRPVFENLLDPAKTAIVAPKYPYDSRPISWYQTKADEAKLAAEEVVMFTTEDAAGLGMLAAQQEELAIETGNDWVRTMEEAETVAATEVGAGPETAADASSSFREDDPRAGGETAISPTLEGKSFPERGAEQPDQLPLRGMKEIALPAAAGSAQQNLWEVNSRELRREGDTGGCAVLRVTDFGLERTPPIPAWLKNRVRLRRVVNVLEQKLACPDLVDDWRKRSNQLEFPIPEGKSLYLTVDYYFHLPSTVPHGAPNWMSKKEREDYQNRKVDPKRGRLSIDQHRASVLIENGIKYGAIGSGVVKSAVHNGPTADKILKQPGKLEDIRIFTCRDLADVPPVVRETARVFRVEEHDNALQIAGTQLSTWRPKLTDKTAETGFSEKYIGRVTDAHLKPITEHLRGGKRVILQCSSGVGLSVAVAERLRSSVYGKSGKVYHASAPLELFIHDMAITPSGKAIRYTDEERIRVDTVLSPLRSMTADERRKVRLLQEVLFLHGKLQSEQKCLEKARGQLREVDEKSLQQLVRVARRDSMARLSLALGIRRGSLGSLSNYEALRSGGVTFVDTTFFTEFGFMYSAIGALSGSDGRGRHAVSGLKWKLEPFLEKSGLSEEEKAALRSGLMFNMLDSYSTRLLKGKASPSVEDVARAIRRLLALYIIRRRLYGDAGLENLGLKDWKSLIDSGRTVSILPTGKAVYKLERRFLSVKTAHKRMRRLPEFHSMGLQYLLDEIDEMLDHLSTVRLRGRSAAQAFWGLEEARPEMLTHPDDTSVARHSWGEMNIHRLTEGRLRIVSELLAMQTDTEFVTDVNKVLSNCRAQVRAEADESNWQVGDELDFYNAKNKTSKRVRLLQKVPDQGTSGFTYVCQGDRGTITARKENLSGGFDFGHYFNLPEGLQPVVAADYKRGGRLYNHQKQWAEDNLKDVDLELQVPANASSHEAGPFFSFDPPGRGTKKKNLVKEKEDSGDSLEVEVSDEDAAEMPLPPVGEVMAAPVPEGEIDEDRGEIDEDDDGPFPEGEELWRNGVEPDGEGGVDLAQMELTGGVFDELQNDPSCRCSRFVMLNEPEETILEKAAVIVQDDTWEEDEKTITRVHGKPRQARCTPTNIGGVVPGLGDLVESHRVTEYKMLGQRRWRREYDLWRQDGTASKSAHSNINFGKKWIGKTTFLKKPEQVGKSLIISVGESVAAAAAGAELPDEEPVDGEEEDSDPKRPRTLEEFLLNPGRTDRRALNKVLLHNQGPIKEDSLLWQMLVQKVCEKRDGVQFCPAAMETHRGWQEDRRELPNPTMQREVLLSWGKARVKVVKTKEDFERSGGENLVRMVLFTLAPTESRPDLGLISIFDPQTAQHGEVTEKLHGALKFADSDHSFIESGHGLGIPDQLQRGHEEEWGKLFKSELIEKWQQGQPCADEAVLTSRAIADLKLMTPWHYKVAIRLVPGGHKSSASATAESPTLSELELRMIIGRLRRVRGKRVMKSGDVPRAFLKNLRFKPENRPRLRFPFNVTQDYVLRALKARLAVGPGDIFVMNISLYGLREAALMWYRTLSQFLHSIGYRSTASSPCVFRKGSSYIGLHVDDLLFCGSEQDFLELATALRMRFKLETWSDAVDGIVFTGMQMHFDEAAAKVSLSMKQKIQELQPAKVPEELERKLTEEEISELKGRRGSLLFIGRAHPELTFPTRCLAIGSDGDKGGRWVRAQSGTISRAKQESGGTTIDLSYRDEVLIIFPDASFQQPTSDERVAAGEELGTELINLNTVYGGGQARGREIGQWRKEDSRNTYIGRGSKWGNPYRAPADGNREEVLQKYATYLKSSGLREQVGELKGKRLGCFCSPFPCHGDVIREAIQEDSELVCVAADEEIGDDLEERREFVRHFGIDTLLDFDRCETVMGATEKDETSRRKRKRFAAVETPSTEQDPTSRKAKQLRGQLGYVFLSVSKDDWELYEKKQVAVKRVETLKEYNDLEKVKLRCSYLHGDSMFMAGTSPSSYDVELHSMGESIPVLEMTLAKLKNWGVRVAGFLLSDSKSAVMRVVSKSVISFADAGVFKILARVKSWYSNSEWELGSVTDKTNPSDSFTKVATGAKIVQLSEVLSGVLVLPVGQAFVHKRRYTWEKPFGHGTTEI
eukprot:g16794.t1